jgi:hypothetical protein
METNSNDSIFQQRWFIETVVICIILVLSILGTMYIGVGITLNTLSISLVSYTLGAMFH